MADGVIFARLIKELHITSTLNQFNLKTQLFLSILPYCAHWACILQTWPDPQWISMKVLSHDSQMMSCGALVCSCKARRCGVCFDWCYVRRHGLMLQISACTLKMCWNRPQNKGWTVIASENTATTKLTGEFGSNETQCRWHWRSEGDRTEVQPAQMLQSLYYRLILDQHIQHISQWISLSHFNKQAERILIKNLSPKLAYLSLYLSITMLLSASALKILYFLAQSIMFQCGQIFFFPKAIWKISDSHCFHA